MRGMRWFGLGILVWSVGTGVRAEGTAGYPDELPPGSGVDGGPIRVTAPDGEYLAAGLEGVAGSGGGSRLAPPSTPDEYLQAAADLRGEPAFEEVLAAAVGYAGLEPGREEALASDAAWSALLPRLRVSLRRQWEHDESLDVTPEGDDDFGVDTDDDMTLDMSVQWDLAGLVAPPAAVAARRLALEAEAARRTLRLQTAQLYFERLRLRLEWALAGPEDAGRRAEIAFAIAERTARLDALTGGWFGRTLATRAEEEQGEAWPNNDGTGGTR